MSDRFRAAEATFLDAVELHDAVIDSETVTNDELHSSLTQVDVAALGLIAYSVEENMSRYASLAHTIFMNAVELTVVPPLTEIQQDTLRKKADAYKGLQEHFAQRSIPTSLTPTQAVRTDEAKK